MMEWYEIPEALEAGRMVFVTDGTVTRRVIGFVWHSLELQLKMEDGKSFWLCHDMFDGCGVQEIGILDSSDGVYIAPLWWIRR